MDKVPTKIRSIRIPVDLDSRITDMASKQHWSVNQWIVLTLERECKPRNKPSELEKGV